MLTPVTFITSLQKRVERQFRFGNWQYLLAHTAVASRNFMMIQEVEDLRKIENLIWRHFDTLWAAFHPFSLVSEQSFSALAACARNVRLEISQAQAELSHNAELRRNWAREMSWSVGELDKHFLTLIALLEDYERRLRRISTLVHHINENGTAARNYKIESASAN